MVDEQKLTWWKQGRVQEPGSRLDAQEVWTLTSCVATGKSLYCSVLCSSSFLKEGETIVNSSSCGCFYDAESTLYGGGLLPGAPPCPALVCLFTVKCLVKVKLLSISKMSVVVFMFLKK